MEDIKEIIDSLAGSLRAIISEYEAMDSIEPFTQRAFKDIKNIITSLHQSSSLTLDSLKQQIVSLKNQKDTLLDLFERDSNKLDENLNLKLNGIRKKYEEFINGLNTEINKSKEKNEQNRQDAMLDIEYYFMSSEQHVEMFIQEYKDATNRYNYQYNIAKESYGNNIIFYNNSLAKELEKINAEFERSLIEYDNNNTSMIEIYNSKITQQGRVIEGINKDYKEKLSDFKVKKRIETENLNNQIRALVDNKNQNIEVIKEKYADISSKMNDQRDNSNSENTLKNQNIIKEFVYNMDELEALLNQQKNQYLAQANEENELYFENLFRLHKAHEKEIYNLKGSSYVEKNLKSKFKKINKEYYDIECENEKTHKAIIDRLDREFSLAQENTNYQRRRLDINRTSSIKALNLEEIRNNKHFQEENNRLEDEMGYEISLANLKYNIDANNVRLDSTIRLLNIDRQIQALDAQHQKSIRKVNNLIRNQRLEIDFANQTNKLIHSFEADKHQRLTNYLTVSNLLEIEKCKVLNNYNHKQYDLNVLNSKLLLNYSKEKFSLQNEKYEATTKHNLKIDDKVLENLITATGFRIQELSIQEGKEYAIEKQNKIYSVDVLSHNVLVNRFKLNIKSLNQALSAFILLVNRLEENIERIISYILTNIEIKPEVYSLIGGFITKIAKEALNYHLRLIKLYESISTGVIDNHLKFEEDFKFKTVLDQLKEKYDADVAFIEGEIKRLTDSINESEAKIDNITNRISRLELTNSFTYDRKKNRSKAVINKNKKTIKKLFKLIKNSEYENEFNRRRIQSLNLRLEGVHNHYIKDINQIKRLQYNSAQAYHILKNEIKDVTVGMVSALQEEISKANSLKLSFEDYASNIERAEHDFILFNEEEIKRLYTILNNFSISNDHNLTASLNKIKAENNMSIKRIRLSANQKIINAKETFSKTDLNQKQEIEQLRHDGIMINKEYERKELQAKLNFDSSVNNILESRQESQATFFTELYAITDNSNDIESSYNQGINQITKEFEAQKGDILAKTISSKQDYQLKLNRYIQARNLIIKNLPYDFKEKRNLNFVETKEKNSEIDLEISNMKTTLYQNRKDSKKNLNSIDYTFQDNINQVYIERKKLLYKEKSKYYSIAKKLR